MAGWISGPESDDEPLNVKMFARKSFAFQGFTEQMEDKLKKIVQQLGGVCDDFPKYILTDKQYYNSLDLLYVKSYGTLYNVTYLRDCVDANRCLNIEPYRFGSKYADKQELKEFESCCQIFHNEQDGCIVCDPHFGHFEVQQKPKRRTKSFIADSENVNAVVKNKPKSKSNSSNKVEKLNNSTKEKSDKTVPIRPVWEHWELRLMLDYVISKNLLNFVKSPSLFKRMHEDGFLRHRTAESMRGNFRIQILRNLRAFDLPEPVFRKLKRINNATFPGRAAAKSIKNKLKKKKVFKQNLKFKQVQVQNINP